MNTSSHYDVAVIGAGMSGLAAGIRLAHFGRRVCIFERHNAVGGLNSFYSIAGRKFDVGLHAMTNFVRPGVKGTPLTKLLRQLRIDRDELALCEQKQSRVAFGPRGETSLRFTNDFAVFASEVAEKFPAQADGFRDLVAAVRTYDDVSLDAVPVSAREVVRRHISDPLLEDMLFCPLMYYGSATERDMEFGQFVIMFKALFLEGFARPFDGVRVVLRVLLEKYRAAGGERRMKCGVKRIISRQGRATALVLDTDEGFGDTMVARLNRFKIRVKADITPLEWRCIAVRGAAVDGVASWGGGVDMLGPDLEPPVSVPAGSADDLLAARIAAVWPAMGAEIVPGETIPAETGITDVAVSFTKGCYPGQELVERMDSRAASAPRLLQGLSVAEAEAVGARVTSQHESRALAYVPRAALTA